jgi:hypothetical protein
LDQDVINGLLLGLKFVPYPAHQHKGVTSTFTVYSKTGKELIYEVAEEAPFRAIRHHNNNLWDTKEQRTFRRMLRSPAWKQLHQDHLVLKTDKNMGTVIVSHNWMTTNCCKFLDDRNMYATYATYNDNNTIQAFYDKLRQRISNWLSNIHEDLCLVTPSKDFYFPSFYTLSKVHKNPVGARPITGAFDLLTSKASKATSNGLREIYKILSIQAQTQGFTSTLTICIKTEDAIKRVNAVIQACTDPQGLSFTTFDFDGMYNHLDATMTINAIKNLAICFCNLPLDYPL